MPQLKKKILRTHQTLNHSPGSLTKKKPHLTHLHNYNVIQAQKKNRNSRVLLPCGDRTSCCSEPMVTKDLHSKGENFFLSMKIISSLLGPYVILVPCDLLFQLQCPLDKSDIFYLSLTIDQHILCEINACTAVVWK